MNTNQTIDGVPRVLIAQAIEFLEAHGSRPSIENCIADDLRALLDAPSITCHGCFAEGVAPAHFDEAGKCKAAQPHGEPVEVVLPEFEPAFEKWWEEDGQYCRAGGGSYEKTFAYRAYEAALADVTRLNTK